MFKPEEIKYLDRTAGIIKGTDETVSFQAFHRYPGICP